MITQTLALFLDAYRELNAKKLFWVTLIVSGVVIGAFALLGVSDRGFTLLTFEFDVPMPQFVYKWAFDFFVVGIWVSWGAIILALVSTAGVFPDLLAGGAIDLYLSKPISRLRLFLTKYATGLLFVLLQSVIFAVVAYLVMGFRAGEWKPSLFLIIPLVVCLFSYVFAISVLFGVLTRSTVAAILLTVLMWALFASASWAEEFVLRFKLMAEHQARAADRQVESLDAEIKATGGAFSLSNPLGMRTANLKQRRDRARQQAQQTWDGARQLGTAHRILYGVATVLPKTSQTINILDRQLFTEAETQATSGGEPPPDAPPAFGGDERDVNRAERVRAFQEADIEGELTLRNRSVTWIIGTSLLFEAVVLALAAWIFCRRDY